MNTPVGTSPPLPQLTTDTMGIPPNGFNDAQIIQQLLGSIPQREALFAYLYGASGWRQWVLHHVSNTGGDVPAGGHFRLAGTADLYRLYRYSCLSEHPGGHPAVYRAAQPLTHETDPVCGWLQRHRRMADGGA